MKILAKENIWNQESLINISIFLRHPIYIIIVNLIKEFIKKLSLNYDS